jgi:hypothetical protein
MLFYVKHLLIICSHFVLLIKSGSVVSERSAPCRLNACHQRGRSTKTWVSKLVSLEDKISRMPKRPLMVGEKKDDGTRDPFKLLIKEAVTKQSNEMIDSFAQILRRLPTGEASSSSGGAAPFKVQINIDIPIFEGQIDVDVVDKWLNLLEGYFSVHNFLNRENITFALLKAILHVKDWWKIFYE